MRSFCATRYFPVTCANQPKVLATCVRCRYQHAYEQNVLWRYGYTGKYAEGGRGVYQLENHVVTLMQVISFRDLGIVYCFVT